MSIYTKLLEIQKLHLEFEKDAKNPFFKSNYVSLDSIVSKLTPHLDKQWLLVTHYTTNGNIVTKVVDVAMDKWEFCIESSFPLIQSTDPQKLWSCITYAKRYNLWQLFNIVTDRDDDGNEASEVETKETKKEVKKDWAVHTCTKCSKESVAEIFKWAYWECFKCEHCKGYSKPNPRKEISIEDMPF